MFYNNRRTIGILVSSSIGESNSLGEYQELVCSKMSDYAVSLGYNVAIFSSYGHGGGNVRYSSGEADFFELLSYDEFAGIILALDANTLRDIKGRVLDKMKEEIKCPVVSLREKIDWANNFLVDNDASIREMVRYLVKECHVKDLAFMTGIKENADAESRLDSFRQAMDELQLPIGENRIYYGDFWIHAGVAACDYFLKDKMPEAILCASDYMAMSVITELEKRNIAPMKDIIVTGFDGYDSGRTFLPSFPTIHVDYEKMAVEAVDCIVKQNLEDTPANNKVSYHLVCDKSVKEKEENVLGAGMLGNSLGISDERLETDIAFMGIDFGELNSIEEMHSVIEKYIHNIKGLTNYAVCLRDDLENYQDNLVGYADIMCTRVWFHNYEDQGKTYSFFDRKQLIPKELSDSKPQCFFFTPLHYQDKTFGYEIYQFENPVYFGSVHLRWSIAVENAIMNILIKSQLKDTVNKLERLYVHDMVTGLYNRFGFEKFGKAIFEQAREQGKSICVFGIDMDGLKSVNDMYGHQEGDYAIRELSRTIRDVDFKNQVSARMGGDEFAVIVFCEEMADVRKWQTAFEEGLATANKISGKEYQIGASIGYKLGIPGENETLEDFVKESDQMMYRNKAGRKEKRER